MYRSVCCAGPQGTRLAADKSVWVCVCACVCVSVGKWWGRGGLWKIREGWEGSEAPERTHKNTQSGCCALVTGRNRWPLSSLWSQSRLTNYFAWLALFKGCFSNFYYGTFTTSSQATDFKRNQCCRPQGIPTISRHLTLGVGCCCSKPQTHGWKENMSKTENMRFSKYSI